MLPLKNKALIRRLLSALFVTIILTIVLIAYINTPLKGDSQIYDYLLKNGYNDTGSENLVTAVYLDYRVFDTLFEALLLMISVTGIIYYLSPWEKVNIKEVDDEE